MAIKITDNFQVNIKNPIDNRFVVGSQSIPGGVGSIYPTPFYAYRDDISSNMGFVYPGLRIWDFNDNLPYVWTGTTWSNENLTGASVLGSGSPTFTPSGGYRNYVTKFYDTGTVLTKSLLYDDYDHVSVVNLTTGAVTGGTNPNNSGNAGTPALNDLASSIKYGLHVEGRIRTNNGFVGNGWYIHNINAQNINGGPASNGRLQLQFINTNGVIANPSTTYVLTTNGNNNSTSWQNILNVAPLYTPINLGTSNSLNGSLAVSLFSGTNGLNHEFFSLVSSGLQIDAGVAGGGSVRIESKSGVNVGGGSASVYKGLNTNKIHEFKTITSDFMKITDGVDGIKLDSNITSSSLQVNPNPNDPHGITIEIPASFEGTDYYVNGYYDANLPQLGTRSKPFTTLARCINKILNRTSIGDPLVPSSPASEDTRDLTINGGNSWEKYEIRSGRNYISDYRAQGYSKPCYQNGYFTNLPGGGAVRIIIQSYLQAFENLAINNVTYFLEKGGYDSHIVIIKSAVNDSATGLPFEYLFDTTPMVDNAPRGNRYFTTYDPSTYQNLPNGSPVNNNPGELDYPINCILEGSGTITFEAEHPTRKGFFKHKGTNAWDWLIANDPTNPYIATAITYYMQHGSYTTIGSIGGYISLNMSPLPTVGVGTPATHISGTVSITKEDGSAYIREGTPMIGYETTSTPNYGLIQVEGRNAMFYQSLYTNGTIVLSANEQHMIFAKDYGSIYSDNGRIYMRRHYQHVLFKGIEYVSNGDGSANPPNSNPSFPVTSITALNNGQYFRVISIGNTNTTTTAIGSFKNMGQSNAWRKAIGGVISPTPYSTISVGDVFRSNGNPGTGTGTIAFCGKRYLPSPHVHDVYLKNGAEFIHGGDFYTQQNTSATEGGPDTFVCLENSIPRIGDATHPYRNGRFTSGCSFAANGGGFITNLHYNYYIKLIMDTSYGSDESNSVSFKNLKIESSIFKGVIRVQDTNGNSWTKIAYAGTFKNCFIGNIRYGSSIIMPFSNMAIYNNDGIYFTNPPTNTIGKMIIGGTTIDLPGGFINTGIPIYTSNANAVTAGLSVGNVYRDTTGNLKVVIP